MSILAAIKEFIARRQREPGPNESPPHEVNVEFWVERYRRMTPAERAETLADAADEWETRNDEQLDYETSLVDLMKLTGQDFALEHRVVLAKEVGWNGDPDNTAAMNEFLYPLVLQRLELVY